MKDLDPKSKAQFWVALSGVIGLLALTAIYVIWDQYRGGSGSQMTSNLIVAASAVASSTVSWLFKSNGNGTYAKDSHVESRTDP